jgi:hypothetical protein
MLRQAGRKRIDQSPLRLVCQRQTDQSRLMNLELQCRKPMEMGCRRQAMAMVIRQIHQMRVSMLLAQGPQVQTPYSLQPWVRLALEARPCSDMLLLQGIEHRKKR